MYLSCIRLHKSVSICLLVSISIYLSLNHSSVKLICIFSFGLYSYVFTSSSERATKTEHCVPTNRKNLTHLHGTSVKQKCAHARARKYTYSTHLLICTHTHTDWYYYTSWLAVLNIIVRSYLSFVMQCVFCCVERLFKPKLIYPIAWKKKTFVYKTDIKNINTLTSERGRMWERQRQR